ncbi:MAG: sodium:solute symporter family protein [candidate division KSB1 bacterium]|nr:sodium:solute symporter family protein [candidate division KSB1 bacterium]MDZ7272622.1 sodium:solute symporter family protein [candidate division KSB1 bacterium]MDZ7284355.1 sodium:solute symporter family protein [candidate division KSB1 bacterium]MDZ7297249.1 sodium:solute symporter family protein [candidate division KSB1 bacterium]MDZ7348116.1 sodium:solute symporter family protein [candidate division KSB1 bacterium]
MTLERGIVAVYMLACIVIGVLASRKVLASRDDYWVAGRRIGTWANALAIMATLASGGSIIGVMGLAYQNGIPYALAMFAGAVLGFPLASLLVAKPLRYFGKFTITDFLVFRYPHPLMRCLVPLVIVISFTAYIVAQMKAAGITANVLLGISYNQAVTGMALVFILYVSIGGMLAVTWTDVMQGLLMLAVVLLTAGMMVVRVGSPVAIMQQATAAAPMLGAVAQQPLTGYLGAFVLWAAAIPVIPHIVMRVFTAKDAQGARLSLNLAMVAYSAMILAAVLAIVPAGKMHFPALADADTIFLEVMKQEFPPLIRGLAVAAVMAAVMSTTDALLLACSSAVTHDLLGGFLAQRYSLKAVNWISVAVAWIIGLLAMYFAYSPPALLTAFYSAAIGLLSAGLFVPVIAGLWWKKATIAGGVASLLTGSVIYLVAQFTPGMPPLSAILLALPASALAMWLCRRFTKPKEAEIVAEIARLHRS